MTHPYRFHGKVVLTGKDEHSGSRGERPHEKPKSSDVSSRGIRGIVGRGSGGLKVSGSEGSLAVKEVGGVSCCICIGFSRNDGVDEAIGQDREKDPEGGVLERDREGTVNVYSLSL